MAWTPPPMPASSAPPAPPIDRGEFQSRAYGIARERTTAREAREDHALKEADAENFYALEKSKRLTALRQAGMSQAEAVIHAEGDAVVANHKRTRNRENALKKSAEYRIEECEANRAMLRKEVDMAGDEGWQ